MVINPDTMQVGPKYHCILDNSFTVFSPGVLRNTKGVVENYLIHYSNLIAEPIETNMIIIMGIDILMRYGTPNQMIH